MTAKTGRPPGRPRTPLLWRFLAKVVVAVSGCWEWQRCRRGPYGSVHAGGSAKKLVQAHRASYELFVGPVPPGLKVLHRCDNASCVNPDHLFLGTNKNNSEDMVQKGRQASGARHGSKTKPHRVARGVRNGNSKLGPGGVKKVRSLRDAGLSLAAIARRVGVCKKSVLNVLSGKTWREVPGGG
jgi:hypothetical protein